MLARSLILLLGLGLALPTSADQRSLCQRFFQSQFPTFRWLLGIDRAPKRPQLEKSLNEKFGRKISWLPIAQKKEITTDTKAFWRQSYLDQLTGNPLASSATFSWRNWAQRQLKSKRSAILDLTSMDLDDHELIYILDELPSDSISGLDLRYNPRLSERSFKSIARTFSFESEYKGTFHTLRYSNSRIRDHNRLAQILSQALPYLRELALDLESYGALKRWARHPNLQRLYLPNLAASNRQILRLLKRKSDTEDLDTAIRAFHKTRRAQARANEQKLPKLADSERAFYDLSESRKFIFPRLRSLRLRFPQSNSDFRTYYKLDELSQSLGIKLFRVRRWTRISNLAAYDGDTVFFDNFFHRGNEDGAKNAVRIIGIDTAEFQRDSRPTHGEELLMAIAARNFLLWQLARAKNVEFVDLSRRMSHGRRPGRLLIDGNDFSGMILREGLALPHWSHSSTAENTNAVWELFYLANKAKAHKWLNIFEENKGQVPNKGTLISIEHLKD